MIKRLFNVVVTVVIIVLLLLGFKELMMFSNAQGMAETLREVAVQVPKGAVEDNTPFARHIDFESLQAINPDIVGWLYVPGTEIDYPIMVGETDEKYLNRDYEGNYSKIGSVFSFSNTNITSDNHIMLFAHNMISGQMFGGLKKFKDFTYAKEHMYAYIYTPDKTKECMLVSTFKCHKTDEVFELKPDANPKTIEEWNKFVNDRSIYSLDIPETASQLYTLVTCDGYSGTPQRLTVNYTVIKEKFVLE